MQSIPISPELDRLEIDMPSPELAEVTLRPELVRLPVVLARTGLSKSEVYRRVAAGTFPRPTRLGYRTSAWSASEIDQWVDARLAQRGQERPA
ncbi:helix-turn-helix transcriptional regulator [Aerolutibacter daejeonensis]|uniref:helix-turn-helix transcriptional regulator n=1 Tax=Aerolutibacter daejeonensis TaxID=346181 RepID=UPI000A71F709|nr:AlpA family transcriptional regulator [Lysobacter daejeonensis]